MSKRGKNNAAIQVEVALIIFDAGYSAYVTYYVESGEIICEQKILKTQGSITDESYFSTVQQNYFLPAHKQTTLELIGAISSDE